MAACVLTSRAQRPTAAAPWAEELEVDPRDLAFGRLRRFLDAIALPAPDVDRLVQVTLTIAVSRGSALLHLEHRDGETTVTVSAPGAEPAATIASAEGSPSRPPLQLVPAP
jgi:hypothetical protein